MTTTQAAQRLGTHPGNIRGYITAGRLTATRIDTPRGPVWDIAESDLMLLYRRKYARLTQEQKPLPVQSDAELPAEIAEVAPGLYSLPDDLLARYHSLLDKRFETGLSDSEEEELAVLSAQLDEADMLTPLEHINADAATKDHIRRMEILDQVIELLGSLQHAHPVQ